MLQCVRLAFLNTLWVLIVGLVGGCTAAELTTPGWDDPLDPNPIQPIVSVLDHWELLLDEAGPWFYLAPDEEPDATWKSAEFVKTSWLSGPGGIGYGDDDDTTVIEPTLSLFMRADVQVVDPDQIL